MEHSTEYPAGIRGVAASARWNIQLAAAAAPRALDGLSVPNATSDRPASARRGRDRTIPQVLWRTTRDAPAEPESERSLRDEKKRRQSMRCREIETLVMERGEAGTKDYRVHVLAKANEDNTTIAEISLWHDVPLVAPGAGTKLRAFSLWPRRGGATCG